MIIIVTILLLIVSFILAWRSLHELEAPPGIVRQISRSISKVKKWGTIIFLQNKRIEYSGEINTDKDGKFSIKSINFSTGEATLVSGEEAERYVKMIQGMFASDINQLSIEIEK